MNGFVTSRLVYLLGLAVSNSSLVPSSTNVAENLLFYIRTSLAAAALSSLSTRARAAAPSSLSFVKDPGAMELVELEGSPKIPRRTEGNKYMVLLLVPVLAVGMVVSSVMQMTPTRSALPPYPRLTASRHLPSPCQLPPSPPLLAPPPKI